MWRSGTIRVAKLGGIAIEIHLTFALVILWGALEGWLQYDRTPQGAVYGVIAIVLLFSCVLLHELAHGLQARSLGLVVRRVILLPIGGLAQLETPPSSPRHELSIALAGPLVNLALTVAIGGLLLVIDPTLLAEPSLIFNQLATPGPQSTLLYLFSVNLSLFLFNMLPAFPMDGGRVLRAGLALVIQYVIATRIAAWIGRGLAVAMILIGLLGLPPGRLRPNLMLANLLLAVGGLVVFSGAHNEEVYVRRQWALARVEVGEIYQRHAETIAPWDTLSQSFVAKLFRYQRILPVIVDKRIVGLLGYDEVHRVLQRAQGVTVAHVMRTDFPILRPRDTLWVALQAMTTEHLTILPVAEENQFRGVVSLDDIDQAWRWVSRR